MPNVNRMHRVKKKTKKKSNKKSKKKTRKKSMKKRGGEVLATGINKPCMFGIDSDICSTDSTLKSISKKLEIGGNNDKKEIIDIAKKKTNCVDESCIYSKMDNLDDLKNSKNRLKEPGPAKSLEWLDNTNIDNVLDKWAYQYKDFLHIPFHMIDFDKKNTYLITMNINNIIKDGYKTAGVILNTDVSTGSGIHWFCLFFDFRKTPISIEYFNSSGEPPLPSVRNLLDRIKTPNSVVFENTMQHQRDTGSECGLYSLYYIINRLKGIPFTDFNKRIPDKEMIKFRKDIFV